MVDIHEHDMTQADSVTFTAVSVTAGVQLQRSVTVVGPRVTQHQVALLPRLINTQIYM